MVDTFIQDNLFADDHFSRPAGASSGHKAESSPAKRNFFTITLLETGYRSAANNESHGDFLNRRDGLTKDKVAHNRRKHGHQLVVKNDDRGVFIFILHRLEIADEERHIEQRNHQHDSQILMLDIQYTWFHVYGVGNTEASKNAGEDEQYFSATVFQISIKDSLVDEVDNTVNERHGCRKHKPSWHDSPPSSWLQSFYIIHKLEILSMSNQARRDDFIV